MPEIDQILEKYPFVQPENLIPILQEIQDEIGYLSQEAIVRVGRYLNVPTSKIYGLATFYNQFRFEEKAKFQIKICNGTSCHVKSNILIIKEIEKKLGIKLGEVTRDKMFSLEETSCMGACGYGPVISINDKFFTQMTVVKTIHLLDSYLYKEEK